MLTTPKPDKSHLGRSVLWSSRYARLPVWATVTLVVLMEVGVGYAIHDNLTLNIIMLLHPFEGIKRWQSTVL